VSTIKGFRGKAVKNLAEDDVINSHVTKPIHSRGRAMLLSLEVQFWSLKFGLDMCYDLYSLKSDTLGLEAPIQQLSPSAISALADPHLHIRSPTQTSPSDHIANINDQIKKQPIWPASV
jgi:hypothetical protein